MMGPFASKALAPIPWLKWLNPTSTWLLNGEPKMGSLSQWTKLLLYFLQGFFYSNVLKGVKKLTINGVDINPAESMTYLRVVLDHKLNKVSKTKKSPGND